MKKGSYVIILTLIFLLNFELRAQTQKSGDVMVSKIEKSLKLISENTSEIKISKSISGRKVRVRGKFDDGTKLFKQKIKYYKGGVKKEIIVVRKPVDGKLYILLKIIRINEEYFYVEENTYSNENPKKIIAAEKLIDGKIYRKIEKKEVGLKTRSVEFWEIK